VLPALKTATLHVWPGAGIGWPLIGVALGAAGLHRGLTYPRPGERATHGDRWPGRMVLFAVLVLVPPLAWASELTRPGVFGARTAQFLVPNIVSAVFLLLLVARLGLIARIAQQRADQLARHSTALATAVSEQDDLRRQLSHRDLHDPLTGLSNRVVLAERMEWALARRRGAGQHALILLDLDGFKDINDTLGHPVGDELLIEVAHRLVGHAPADATLARLGGDEFAVLLEETEPTASARWAETFRGALRRPYSIGGRDLFLTTSIGVRCTDPGQGATTPSDTLRDADLALYAAKEEGKDRVLIFYPGLRTARLDHTRISTGLRHALANDEFLLHYQPIVDLATDEVVAVEALIRWQPPGAALLPPADFIPVAEDTGLITPIGDWVLRRACHEARRWYEERDVAVSVNVSGRQLEDARFADGVFDALGEAGLPGRALILEITESNLVATAHGEALHGQLARLRAAGVRIAIDDFGTGYSSLSYVAQLPVDIVKIDKSFTQQDADVDFAPQDWAFTRAILQLVESLQMLAIAEGVETQSQADALRLLRCPLVQGFHFSRPMPASAVDRTLATSDRVGPGRDPAQTPPGSVRGSRTSRSGVR
jgi:diguanylate cyclase (GGDEF)-like protein